MKRSIHFFSILLLISALSLSCGGDKSVASYSFFMADTYFSVKVYDIEGFDGVSFEKLLRSYSDEMDRFKKGSAIWELNNKGEISAPSWLAELIKTALEMKEKTSGAFDVTLGEYSDLWGFPTGDMAVPSAQAINTLISKKRKLTVSGNVIKVENCIVDLGAMGKGFLLEKAAEYLLSKEIGTFLLNFGGNVYASGDREYRVGLQDPRDSSGVYYKVIKLKNNSVATSGDYRRYFFAGDKRYCHIFDPSTGYPPDRFKSVSIVCDSPMISDILSTAVFVGGKTAASFSKDIEIHTKP